MNEWKVWKADNVVVWGCESCGWYLWGVAVFDTNTGTGDNNLIYTKSGAIARTF